LVFRWNSRLLELRGDREGNAMGADGFWARPVREMLVARTGVAYYGA
jgi:hypothetical protein